MGGGVSSAPPRSYSGIFEECFPYYLAIGMTDEQYWRQDCTLVKAYRRADEIRRKRINEEAWLHGVYIYGALCRVAPVLNAFAKDGTEPIPYPERPVPVTAEEQRAQEEAQMKEQAERFRKFATAKNAEIRKTGGE